MIFSTLDGQVHAANPAACRMLAMTETEIRRRGRAALVDNLDDPELETWLAERDRTGAGNGETRLYRPDGRIVDLSVQSRLFADTDGTVMSFSVFRDVTAKAETARAIEELSARVERVALTDRLTGLANRRGLVVAGTELCARADRERAPSRCSTSTRDNMAELNARLGPRAGDTALVGLARALSGAFEPDDVLARIAGTGFIVLAYARDSADASPSAAPGGSPARPARRPEPRRRPGRPLLRMGHPTTRVRDFARGPHRPGRPEHVEGAGCDLDRAGHFPHLKETATAGCPAGGPAEGWKKSNPLRAPR